ncbi:hypothetical protein ACMFMG_012127 [Clarireedia jacksonii]
MIGDFPVLHLLKDNHSTPITYPAIPEMVGGTSGWKERIALLVNEPEPRFLLTSLEDPDLDLRNIISSFFSDILENNQLSTDKRFLDDQISPYSGTTIFEVSTQRFEGLWINGTLAIERCTQWQTGRDELITAPEGRSWIGGREEKPQEFATVRSSASWNIWSLDTMQGKEDAVEALIDREILQGLNSGKPDDEVGETAAQSDCIPSTTLGNEYGAEEKSTNREGSSTLYERSTSIEKSGWYPDDKGEAWVEWTAYWSTSVEWLRHLCFGCVGRR